MRHILLSTTLVLGMGFWACSDDTTPTSDTKATTVDKGATTTDKAVTQTDKAKTDTKSTDIKVTTDIKITTDVASGACTNAADLTLLDTADKQAGVKTKATTCAMGCLADANPGTCSAACVKKDTGLSDGCSACYATVIVCTITNCVNFCAAAPSSADCVNCQNGKDPSTTHVDCVTPFYACTGLPKQ
jgi:hypothetical protein